MSDTQFRLLIKTTLSKLQFKLSKSRSISTNTIQTTIKQDLINLSKLPNDSRSFERSLDILYMKLSQLVRTDRVNDVWEDLIGELTILESSIHVLSKMYDEQLQLQKQRQYEKQQQQGWFFTKKLSLSEKNDEKKEEEQGGEGEEEGDDDNDKENITSITKIDRISKVIRNIIIAQNYLGDDIKELKKLSLSLRKCIDSKIIDIIPTQSDELDLQDKICLEMIRKLNGVDEGLVVKDYLNELSDVFKIDLYNEGKYGNDGGDDNDKDNNDNNNKKLLTSDTSKKLDDLDELKNRFAALKK